MNDISFSRSVQLIAGREIQARLRSRAFIVSAAILLVAVLASIVVGSIVSRSTASDTTTVAVVSGVDARVSGTPLRDVPGIDVRDASSVAVAERGVRNGDVDAAIVPSDDTLGFSVIALDSAPDTLVGQLSATPTVRLLDPSDQSSGLVYFVGLGFGVVFFMAAVTFGATIAQSVVEEKSTRVVEILMSATSAKALMAGKVIGNSIMALAQIVLIAVVAAVALAVTGQDDLFAALGPSALWFVLFFAVGFVLIASLYAAAASLVARQEDVGSVTSPVMMLVMIPYFLIIFFSDNSAVLAVMSYVPFSAPVGMPMRIFLGEAAWWEPIVSLVVIVLTAAAAVLLGSRIYENSLLRTGGRVKVLEALRG
ncbi:ABC transporter permease [Curtobacterium sp. Leaf261]|uniref:ABC transporter permease n=1 Tax=Curtobacterium sp. Leaf261 TaxID=1736311 RepID=UPI0006F92488|nr:ABC transporter permease [Curtobacterium sp. Leaf261]KQO62856.1 sodium ABC transporter permease [Curtobacterium sp. Leaf261]